MPCGGMGDVHVSSLCYFDAERFRSRICGALDLEHNANRCIALVDECQFPKTKRFLRLLAVDLMIEADKLRRGDGAEALLVIESVLR